MATPTTLTELNLDGDGYLESHLDWTPEVAAILAAEEGITLTERHFIVLDYARNVYAETDDAPTLRAITKNTDVSTKELYKLFPKGPAKKAARIAGLKKPTGCL